MPVSDITNIVPILTKIVRSSPKSILELGVGFGKYGCLIREVLDAVEGRVKKSDSPIYLAGVEGFSEYNNPNWNHYNSLFTENFADKENWDKYRGYELVIAIDSLEHIDKDVALELLKYLVENNREVIVSVPIGEWPQDAVFGNPYEVHRASWYESDFVIFRAENKFNMTMLHKSVCGVYSISK